MIVRISSILLHFTRCPARYCFPLFSGFFTMSSGVVWFPVFERFSYVCRLVSGVEPFFRVLWVFCRSTGHSRRSASGRHMAGYLLPVHTTPRSPEHIGPSLTLTFLINSTAPCSQGWQS